MAKGLSVCRHGRRQATSAHHRLCEPPPYLHSIMDASRRPMTASPAAPITTCGQSLRACQTPTSRARAPVQLISAAASSNMRRRHLYFRWAPLRCWVKSCALVSAAADSRDGLEYLSLVTSSVILMSSPSAALWPCSLGCWGRPSRRGCPAR